MATDLRFLDCLPDVVVVVRPDGLIEYANSQTKEMLGYEPAEVTGKPLDLFIPERFRPQHAQYVRAYCSNPVLRPMASRLELFAVRKDGRELPVDVSLGFIPTEQGVRVVGTMRDISHRKTEELRLKEALAQIEDLRRRTVLESHYLAQELDSEIGFGEIVGQCQCIRETREKIEQVGPTDLSVLILGETGTGKELVARAIHGASPRNDHPLIRVNCAALHDELIESELFGHEKGAFTGAFARKIGRFELADRSTIFLDEVAEIPLQLQAKLLRVLQEREFERLGSTATTKVNVRVIAATNRDIHRMIREGTFRADLYFRLAVFLIEVPSLNARRADIPLLAWHIIRQKQAKLGKVIEEIPPDVMDVLCEFDWQGNVRELENVIERGLVVSHGPVFSLGAPLTRSNGSPQPQKISDGTQQADSLQEVERSHILKVLTSCEWRIKGKGNAADRLGLSPSTLRFRMKRLHIIRPCADADA